MPFGVVLRPTIWGFPLFYVVKQAYLNSVSSGAGLCVAAFVMEVRVLPSGKSCSGARVERPRIKGRGTTVALLLRLVRGHEPDPSRERQACWGHRCYCSAWKTALGLRGAMLRLAVTAAKCANSLCRFSKCEELGGFCYHPGGWFCGDLGPFWLSQSKRSDPALSSLAVKQRLPCEEVAVEQDLCSA